MTDTFLGRSIEALRLSERRLLSGKWLAFELYSPQTVPMRLIAAVGASAAECVKALRTRGLDPSRFEFTTYTPR